MPVHVKHPSNFLEIGRAAARIHRGALRLLLSCRKLAKIIPRSGAYMTLRLNGPTNRRLLTCTSQSGDGDASLILKSPDSPTYTNSEDDAEIVGLQELASSRCSKYGGLLPFRAMSLPPATPVRF